MSTRHIDLATLWVKRKHDKDAPAECLLAWDGWSIEENWEGWRDAVDHQLATLGADLWQYRLFNILVPEQPIEESFAEFRTVPAGAISELDDPRSL
jgi:hypothetical protein